MKFDQIASHMRLRADWLLSGRLDSLVQDYVFPIPVDLLSTRIIVRSADEARAMLDLQRLSLAERGVVSLKAELSAVDLPSRGRFRAWVDWHELSATGESTRVSSAIYYCRAGASGLRIEMIHYSQLSMPEMKPQFAALALTA